MTHLSPAAFTAWSVLSTTVCTTVMSYTLLCWQQLISRHDGRVRCVDFSLATCGGLTGSNAFGMWSFLLLGLEARADRDSYSWSSGPYTGAFKRFMTVCFFKLTTGSDATHGTHRRQYTYMLTLPLLMTYSYGFTYIKYMEGYADVPHLGSTSISHLCNSYWSHILHRSASRPQAVWPMARKVPKSRLPFEPTLFVCLVIRNVSRSFPIWFLFCSIRRANEYKGIPSSHNVRLDFFLLFLIHQSKDSVLITRCSRSITHLEGPLDFTDHFDLLPTHYLHPVELCFWLFLVTAGPSQIYWFKSIYFRICLGGSISALVYVPVVTILSRNDPLQVRERSSTPQVRGFSLTTNLHSSKVWGSYVLSRQSWRSCHYHHVYSYFVSGTLIGEEEFILNSLTHYVGGHSQRSWIKLYVWNKTFPLSPLRITHGWCLPTETRRCKWWSDNSLEDFLWDECVYVLTCLGTADIS